MIQDTPAAWASLEEYLSTATEPIRGLLVLAAEADLIEQKILDPALAVITGIQDRLDTLGDAMLQVGAAVDIMDVDVHLRPIKIKITIEQ